MPDLYIVTDNITVFNIFNLCYQLYLRVKDTNFTLEKQK